MKKLIAVSILQIILTTSNAQVPTSDKIWEILHLCLPNQNVDIPSFLHDKNYEMSQSDTDHIVYRNAKSNTGYIIYFNKQRFNELSYLTYNSKENYSIISDAKELGFVLSDSHYSQAKKSIVSFYRYKGTILSFFQVVKSDKILYYIGASHSDK